ncbi:serine/threonine-protein kinase [Pendulispora albinea]|uniref:Serine/threonine protein kinase n=1 Tax=Pendulispora albinea TaxID=2741071 RepID=A0ABZ2MAV6_9BACT
MSAPTLRPWTSERVLARLETTVQRKYRIERLIGVGGMSAVYAATHRNGHKVAIKFLLECFAGEPEICQLFGREAYVANRIGHPGAVPILDDDVDETGCPFLIMPLLEGEPLRARWDRASGRRLPLAEVAMAVSDALDVLASAHAKGIVHRDIKPDNLFVTNTGHVRVLDFGIARSLDGDASVSTTGHMVGTPAFMPPEQVMGDRKAIGPHSDCWAVGATIFTLLSGEFVHRTDGRGALLVAAATKSARSVATVVPSLPRALVQFVDKALAFDGGDRWSSAREMRSALGPAFEDALGEPFSTIVGQVRAEITAELSPLSDDLRRQPTERPDLPEPKPQGEPDTRVDASMRGDTVSSQGRARPAHAVSVAADADAVPTMKAAGLTTSPRRRGGEPQRAIRKEPSTRAVAAEMRVFHCGDGVAVGQYGCLSFVVWREGVTRPKFEKQAAGLAEVMRGHPQGAGFLCIIEAGTKPPNESLRRASTEMLRAHGDRLKCISAVIGGDGFWGALTRSVLLGIATLFVHRTPATPFADVPSAVEWMGSHIPIDSTEKAAAFIEDVRTQLASR